MKKHITNYVLFFSSVYLMFLYFMVGYVKRTDSSIDSILCYILIPVTELIFMAIAGLYFYLKNDKSIFSRLIYLVIPLVVALVYVFQCYSIHIANNYISVLAIENFAENRLVRSWLLYGLIIAVTLFWLLVFFYKNQKNPHQRFKRKQYVVILLVFISMVYVFSFIFQKNSLSIEIRDFQAPVSTLVKNLTRTNSFLLSSRLPNKPDMNFYYNVNSEFPFKKTYIFSDVGPFNTVKKPLIKPNVIVLFTEGMSARLINVYGGVNEGLTPNIDAFSRKSMIVKNYYNHTAATYSGLRGQMVSGFPGISGDKGWGKASDLVAKVNYRSLSQILHRHGYKTFFMSPHHDTVKLNPALRALHFDKVYSYESIEGDLLHHKIQNTAGSASDKNLFEALITFLEMYKQNREEQPFFVGTYNIGTHAFLNSDNTGIKYRNGSNQVLNRMHNYDHQLGKFLTYFYNSKYAKNTILILTADHATYPEKDFVSVAGSNYTPYFIDRIPLMIYAPPVFVDLPTHYDAEGRTSIDFTPSLLHLLNINKEENSFLGRSIFEKKRTIPFGVAAISGGTAFYATDSSTVYSVNSVPKKYKRKLLAYIDYIKLYYEKEESNLIFPPSRITE